MKNLKSYIKKQKFLPDFGGVFFNPFFFARRGIYLSIKELKNEISGELLDVGCGSKPYKDLLSTTKYIGLEIDSQEARQRGIADKFYEGNAFPFEDNSFDVILCNQVLEHVFNPDVFLKEIHRVLRPSGRLLLTVPFVWDEHEQPYDYARYSSFGLRALLEKQGFKYLYHKKLGADPSCLFQLTNAYLYKITQRFSKPAKLLFTVTVMAWVNIAGLIARAILPGNPDLFLDHVVLVEKLK